MDERQRDEILIGLHRDMAAVKVSAGGIRSDLDELKRRTQIIGDQVVALSTRTEDHTGRIRLLEDGHQVARERLASAVSDHQSSGARYRGIWIGASALLTFIAAVSALVATMLQR